MRIVEVIRPGPTVLHRRVWRFVYSDAYHALVLDSYESQERTSTRHKFRTIAVYHRLGQTSDIERIAEGDVVVPGDVETEVYKTFVSTLRVAKPSVLKDEKRWAWRSRASSGT